MIITKHLYSCFWLKLYDDEEISDLLTEFLNKGCDFIPTPTKAGISIGFDLSQFDGQLAVHRWLKERIGLLEKKYQGIFDSVAVEPERRAIERGALTTVFSILKKDPLSLSPFLCLQVMAGRDVLIFHWIVGKETNPTNYKVDVNEVETSFTTHLYHFYSNPNIKERLLFEANFCSCSRLASDGAGAM